MPGGSIGFYAYCGCGVRKMCLGYVWTIYLVGEKIVLSRNEKGFNAEVVWNEHDCGEQMSECSGEIEMRYEEKQIMDVNTCL